MVRHRTNITCRYACTSNLLHLSVFSIQRSALLSALQISGQIQDADGNVRYILKGYWDQQYDVAKVISGEGKNAVTEPFVTLWRAREAE